MTPEGHVACVIVAAGVGERLGVGVPKALVLLDGAPLLAYAISAVAAADTGASGGTVSVAGSAGTAGSANRALPNGNALVDLLVVVGPAGRLHDVEQVAADAWPPGRDVLVVAGGVDRVASVRAGIEALPQSVTTVLVHDAARCLMPPSMFSAVIAAIRSGSDAVVPGMPVADTIKAIHPGTAPPWRVRSTPQRASLRSVQTPQGFSRRVLEAAHAAAADPHARQAVATDDAGLVEAAGGEVDVIPGHADGFKITTIADLRMAEWVLAARAGRPQDRPAT